MYKPHVAKCVLIMSHVEVCRFYNGLNEHSALLLCYFMLIDE